MTETPEQKIGFLCLHCNYPLRGLPENRCPECGNEFDPDDATTMNIGRAIGARTRTWLKPVGRLFNILAIANGVLMLLAAMYPGGFFVPFLFSFMIWLCIGAWWALRVLAFLAISVIYRQPTFWHRMQWRRWFAAPVVVVLTLGCLAIDAPLHAAFLVSQPSMTRLVRQLAQSPSGRLPDQWVGVFHAEDIEKRPWGMKFMVSGAGFLDSWGFAYSPDGWPSDADETRYRRLHGNWYTLAEWF